VPRLLPAPARAPLVAARVRARRGALAGARSRIDPGIRAADLRLLPAGRRDAGDDRLPVRLDPARHRAARGGARRVLRADLALRRGTRRGRSGAPRSPAVDPRGAGDRPRGAPAPQLPTPRAPEGLRWRATKSSQVSYQILMLRGLRIQWFSSGKTSSSDGTPWCCSASKSASASPIGTR